MFGICDERAFAEPDLSAPVPGHGWLGVGRSAVLIGVVMDFLGLHVGIERWNGGAMLMTCGSASGWTRRAYLPE